MTGNHYILYVRSTSNANQLQFVHEVMLHLVAQLRIFQDDIQVLTYDIHNFFFKRTFIENHNVLSTSKIKHRLLLVFSTF